jgi:hypothetical protein
MKNLLLTTALLVLFSCGPNETCKECKTANNDTVTEQEPENLDAALAKDAVPAAPSKEQQENHKKIVKKYGEQWDFCTCIVASDSINDAFEKGKMTPEQEEKLMARWEYVDLKCKELTTNPSTTPEERARHDKRVMKCLKENGLKK